MIFVIMIAVFWWKWYHRSKTFVSYDLKYKMEKSSLSLASSIRFREWLAQTGVIGITMFLSVWYDWCAINKGPWMGYVRSLT
jgi:hypothetical protein